MAKDTRTARGGEQPTQEDYYTQWRGQVVKCVFQDGKALQGTLVSWDPYALLLEQGSRPVVVYKGALKYMLPAGGAGSGEEG
ncbi:MAG: RNA chaperone Hfq [Chloroflexi bacterium]|nr:RNA chaperone Hfq [Chloroflexota bacterium]MBU1746166.1 RNA chaperone Hfq [Chloroflexota bacterium]MBU1878886.1 RNA chaperone Hfq [Chloroflexota bacterium]